MGSIPALEGRIQMDKPTDLASRPSTSRVPIDVASAEMVLREKDKAPKQCKHFSIRGLANEMLGKDPRLCSPFIADGDTTTCIITWRSEPMKLPQSRYWACRGCVGLERRTEEGTSTSVATVPGCDDDSCFCKAHFAPERPKAGDSVPVRSGNVGEASTSNGPIDNRSLSKTIKACAGGVNDDANEDGLQVALEVNNSAAPAGNGGPNDKSCGPSRPRNSVHAGDQSNHPKKNALANSHQPIELHVNSDRNREVQVAGLANQIGSSIDNAATPGRLVPLPDLNASDNASPEDSDDETISDNDFFEGEEEEDSECTPDGKGPKVRSLSELLAVKDNGTVEQAGKGIVPHVVGSPPIAPPEDVSVSKIGGPSSKRKKKKNNNLEEEYRPLEIRSSCGFLWNKKARNLDIEPQRSHQTVELSDSETDHDEPHPSAATKRRAKHTPDGDTSPEKKTFPGYIHWNIRPRPVDNESQRTHQTVEHSDSEPDQDASHPTVATKRRAKHTSDGVTNLEKKTLEIRGSGSFHINIKPRPVDIESQRNHRMVGHSDSEPDQDAHYPNVATKRRAKHTPDGYTNPENKTFPGYIHWNIRPRPVDIESQRTHQTVEHSDSEPDQDASHPNVATKRRAKHTPDGDTNPEKKTKKTKHTVDENSVMSKNPSLQDPEAVAPRISTGSWISQFLKSSATAERDSGSSGKTNRTTQDGKLPTSSVPWKDWQGGTSSVTITDAQLRQRSTLDTQNSSVRTPADQFSMRCFTGGNYSATSPAASVRGHVGPDHGIQERPNVRGKEKSVPQHWAGSPLAHHQTSSAAHHRVQIDINALPVEDKGIEQEVVEMMAQNQYERMQGDPAAGPSRMVHHQQPQHPGGAPYNRESGINAGFTDVRSMRQNEIFHVADLGRIHVGSTMGHQKENPSSIRLGVSAHRQQNPPLSGPMPSSNWNPNMQRQGGLHSFLWGMDQIDKYNYEPGDRPFLWPYARVPFGNGEFHTQNASQKGKSNQGSKQQGTLLDFSGVNLGKQNTNFSRPTNINHPESASAAASTAKRKGTAGPVHLYSNDTIPAMQLLDLMHNGGTQSKVGTPYRGQRNSEPFIRNSPFLPGSGGAHRTGSPNSRVPSVVHDSQPSRVSVQEKGCTTCTSALSIVSSFASAFQNMDAAGYNAGGRNSMCMAPGPLVIREQQWNMDNSPDARSQRFRPLPGSDSGRRPHHQGVLAREDGRAIAGTTISSKGKGIAGTMTSGKGKGVAVPSIAACPPPPTPLAILDPATLVGSGSSQLVKRPPLPTPKAERCFINRNPAEFNDYDTVKKYMRSPVGLKAKRKSKFEKPPRPKAVLRRPSKKQSDDAGCTREKYLEGQQK